MNAKTRSKIEMGLRVLRFSQAHPDPSPGYAAALADLEAGLTRAQQLADRQQQGIAAFRGANQQKRFLRRKMRTQLGHLARVAERAAKEVPELRAKFVPGPGALSYQSFRTAARTMVAEATGNKELLVRYGLADTVLDSLTQNLQRFEQLLEQAADARRQHVGASAELDVEGDETVNTVKVMDGLNRSRFGEDAEVLAEWTSASNVIGPSRSVAEKQTTPVPPTSGEQERPAA